jgi:hypothetical protein
MRGNCCVATHGCQKGGKRMRTLFVVLMVMVFCSLGLVQAQVMPSRPVPYPQKPQRPQTQPIPGSTKTQFQVVELNENETIPKGFKGDNDKIIELIKTLQNTIFVKDKNIYIGPKEVVDKVYTFKVDDSVVYSNPTGVWITRESKGVKRDLHGPMYLIKDTGIKKYNWVGQNIFAARTNVKTEISKKYYIVLNANIDKLPVSFINSKIGVLLIGKPIQIGMGTSGISGSYFVTDASGYNATLERPSEYEEQYIGLMLNLQEVVVYDQGSGKVLFKGKP